MGRADDVSPEDDELSSGTPVGEYVVEDKLGEGAFGKVYRGRQPLIGKAVAIKLLSRKFSADPEMVSRFVAEARAVNQIAHRNIIDIFSFGHLPDGRLYFVMELLQGRTLDQVLRARGSLSVAEALPILRGLARALDAAHAQGIAHRDLKPANVFITTDDDGQPYPKLLDFGIAKLVRPDANTMHKTRTGAPMGTPYYMSPEQCRGEAIETRTDAYSFGVMIFQLLTGRLPFSGDSYVEILFKHMTLEPPAPSSVSAAVPPELDGIVLGLMAKTPEARPTRLLDAVRALEAAAVALGVSVPRSFSDRPPSSDLSSGDFDPRPAPHAPATEGAFAETAPSDPEKRPSLDGVGARSDPKARIAALMASPAPRSAGAASAPGSTPLPGAVPSAAGGAPSQPRAMGPHVLSQTLPAGSADPVPRPRRSLAFAAIAITLAAAVVVLLLRENTAPLDLPAVAAPSAPPRPTMPAMVEVPDRPLGTVDAGPEVMAADPEPMVPDEATATSSVVRWRLEGSPEGAEAVSAEGAVLCTIPCSVDLTRDMAALPITFRAAGFASRTQTIVPTDDGVVSVALEKKRERGPRPNRPRRPSKDDVEEAF